MTKAIKIDFIVNGNDNEKKAITFYGTAARIESVKAALLTREFSLSVDGVGKIRSASISVDGTRYSAKIKSGEQAAAILNYNKAARARKDAQKAAAAEAVPARKSFEDYETENPAELCNIMSTALRIARARRGDKQEIIYYRKQVIDLKAQLAKAEAAEKRAQEIFDEAAAMRDEDFSALVIEALETQYAHEDEVAREKRAKRREESGITALAAKYGITAEALTKALEAEAAAAAFAQA